MDSRYLPVRVSGPCVHMSHTIWRSSVREEDHDLVHRLGIGAQEVPEQAECA